MGRNLSPGDNVNGYTIIELLNTGGMAQSYAAKTGSDAKVFLKKYKSPSVAIEWYKDYVQYQSEIKKRIEASPTLKTMTVRFVDTFEAPAGPLTYFQVFEYVKGGEDLEQILARMQSEPASFSWQQRIIFAKVIMTCIHGIHTAGIVHCDLKPPNLQLFKDTEIIAGYRLKLIDMDFSILKERQAPWHGKEGYVGSPNYFSPEHLRGEIPQTASDVFTCGLILYEMLALGGHPYRYEDETKYRDAVLAHAAAPPRLACLSEGAEDGGIAQMLHRCLSPDPGQRPTAGDILDSLNSIPEASLTTTPPVALAPSPPPSEATIPAAPTSEASGKLELKPESGTSLFFGIKTQVGKNLCRACGADAQFMDVHQFTVERDSSGGWQIVPNAVATNETLLNGKTLSGPSVLNAGDVIGVGRESKGIVKLPLKVCFP